jgi:cytochrome c553
MRHAARDLTGAEIASLAAYFASLALAELNDMSG